MTKGWLKRFRRDEAGAVTVDWVVLTAIIIGMTIGIIVLLQTAATDPATGIGAFIAAREV